MVAVCSFQEKSHVPRGSWAKHCADPNRNSTANLVMADMAARLAGTLIVSCQPTPKTCGHSSGAMAFMARAAEMAGASAIRASGPDHIAAIKRVVDIPVIGLVKRRVEGSAVYITPCIEDARLVAEAGADLIAVDATLRPRPDGITAAANTRRVVGELGLPMVADIDSVAAARVACDSGAAFVATTLAGYTGEERVDGGPDLGLVQALSGAVACPVIAEGRYRNPGHVAEAFRAGAHAVVVGRAITDPFGLALPFVAATPSYAGPR